MGLQHKVPVSRTSSSSVLRAKSGGDGRGGISLWSLAVRRNSVQAGGQKDLYQEPAGKIETHAQAEPGHNPRSHQRGWRAELGSAAQLTLTHTG